MRDGDNFEILDAAKVVRVHRKHRQFASDRNRDDERIVRSDAWLAPRPSKIRGHPTKGSRCRGIEREWIEIRFRLWPGFIGCDSVFKSSAPKAVTPAYTIIIDTNNSVVGYVNVYMRSHSWFYQPVFDARMIL